MCVRERKRCVCEREGGRQTDRQNCTRNKEGISTDHRRPIYLELLVEYQVFQYRYYSMQHLLSSRENYASLYNLLSTFAVLE